MSERQDEYQGSREARDEEALSEGVERAAGAIVGIGRLWAAHGLNVGRSALEASAATLRTTAGLLGEIAERFADDEEPQKGDPHTA